MLKHLHVTPLAAESLGTRSMCTYVETPDVRILLDAGVSLCPFRFGLPPHPVEFKTIIDSRKKIADAADKAEVVTISHYHFDHHTPSYEDWLCNWTTLDDTARQVYEGKTVLAKNPREMINYSQRRRGWVFQKTSGKYAQKLETADGKTFTFGKTHLTFSEPVFHGSEDSHLGWVLMATVEFEGEKFMFAPDVQGPMSVETLKLIVKEKPRLLMIGGPPLYLAGFRVGEDQIAAGLKNLEKLTQKVPFIILEHHILRDENWREKNAKVYERANKSECYVLTAAEFLGKENRFLEATRKKLFADYPPSKEFEKWKRGLARTRNPPKPPI